MRCPTSTQPPLLALGWGEKIHLNAFRKHRFHWAGRARRPGWACRKICCHGKEEEEGERSLRGQGRKGRVHSAPLLCPTARAGLTQPGERSSPFHSWRTHLQRQPSVHRGKFKGANAAVSHPTGLGPWPCWDTRLPRPVGPEHRARGARASPARWQQVKTQSFQPQHPLLT